MYRLRNSHFRVAICLVGAFALVSGLAACAPASESQPDTTVATFSPASSVGTAPTTVAARPGVAGTVVRVVDGDTVVVNVNGTEEKVRLIGIDTPETVDPRKPVQCFGREASNHTKELLPPGTPVTLVADVEPRDRYRRMLSYIYRSSDNLFVNLALVNDGYARVYTYPPNVAHVDEFRAAERSARDAKRGLWSTC